MIQLAFLIATLAISVVSIIFVCRQLPMVARILLGIVGGVFALLFIAVLFAAVFLREVVLPTLAQLQEKFPAEQTDLQTLVRMSDQDFSYARIAPGFKARLVVSSPGNGLHEDQTTPNLSEDRWATYRSIFNRNGIKFGINRDQSGDVFVMVDTVGMLNRGHAAGYLFCAPGENRQTVQFEPCLQDKDFGSQKYQENPRAEAYSFQRVAEHWYVFDQGPS